MRQFIHLCMAGFLLAVGIYAAGCAPIQAPVPSTAPTLAAEEEPLPTPPPAAEVTVTPLPEAETVSVAADGAIDLWIDDGRAEVMRGLAAGLSVTLPVTVTGKPFGSLRTDFIAAVEAGEAPDLLVGTHDWLGELVEDGLLAPIDLGDRRDLFLPAAVDACSYEGVLYGLPFATENISLVYNFDFLQEPPKTWTELAELARTLEDEGKVEQGFVFVPGDAYHFYPIQTAFGGRIFDAEGEVGLDSEGSLAAAQWLDDLYKSGVLTPEGEESYDSALESFTSGKAAMMLTGPWALRSLRASGVPYVVAKQLPGEKEAGVPFIGVQCFMIGAGSPHQQGLQQSLVDTIATPGAMQALFEADPRPSAFLSVRAVTEDPDLAAFAAAGTNGEPMPSIPQMAAVWMAWGGALSQIADQSADPVEAMRTAAEAARDALAGGP